MEKFFKFTAIILLATIIFGACEATDQSKKDSDVFAVLTEPFELLGCTWKVAKLEKMTDIREFDKQGAFATNFWPEYGFFYILDIDITPGQVPTLNPRFVRFELVDVSGRRYFITKNDQAINTHSINSKRVSLIGFKSNVINKLESFLILDVPPNLKGVTLEIIRTDSDPEKRVAIIDLKE